MQTTKLLLAFLCANSTVMAGDAPAPTPKRLFEYHFATLRGATLQPAGGLHTSSGLQAAGGLQPSAGDRGAGPVETRPMTDEQWRALFPKKKEEK